MSPFAFAVGQLVTLAVIPQDGSPPERISGRLIFADQGHGLIAVRKDGLTWLRLVSFGLLPGNFLPVSLTRDRRPVHTVR